VILVWGFKSYIHFLGVITMICGHCHNLAAQRLEKRVRKFTFFWIPLFPVSRKTVLTCTFCGTASVVGQEQAADLSAQISVLPPVATSFPPVSTPTTPTTPVTGPPDAPQG
jgi:hypothetical protein